MLSYQGIALLVLQLLQVAGSKNTISPSYVWPLRFIYNKTVPVVPPLAVHGQVQKDDSGLHFDGKTAWLDAGELPGSCISQPQTCLNGLSIALRVKLLNSNTTATSPKFLIDSGGFNGEGVSLYMKEGQIYGEVADKKRFWRVSSELDSQKWHFILLTWSVQDGLMLFIDGPRKAQNSQSMSFQLKPVATSKHIILGRCNAEMGATFAAFSSDMVALFDSVTPDGKVYLSYSFSAPSTRGNIRYVNAKFINTADFDLTIFPDRGEHLKTGYQLEAHSSTLLEYVLREGQMPIGMNFRLQNKKNGEQLRFNGKYDLHVISSDDKQAVKEYRIQQDATIKTALSTSAVSINYQIVPAEVTIEQQIAGIGAQPTNIASGSQQTNVASGSQPANVASGSQPTKVTSGLQQTNTAPASQQPAATSEPQQANVASGSQQTNVSSGSQQTNVSSGSQKISGGTQTTDEQNALLDNPENPLDEETSDNKTAPSVAVSKPSLNQQGELPTASNAKNTTNLPIENNTKPPAEITSTIAPTVPPPPQFSTPKPTYNKTETNITQTGGKVSVSNQGNGTSIPSPEIPDDDAKLSGLDLNLNISANATGESGTDQDLDEMLGGAGVNMTSAGNVTSSMNTTSTNATTPTTMPTETPTKMVTNANVSATTNANTTTATNSNTSSANGTETLVPVTTEEKVSSTVTPNVTKEEKLTTTAKPTEAKNVTNLILTSANTSSVNETNVQNVSKPIEPSKVSGNVLEKFVPTIPKTGDAKKPVIAVINSQNPWMVIAKQTQGQQRPILWQNGQGIHKAIYGSVDKENNQDGIAPVNYNAGTKVENIPVWQQVNGQPDINDWFTTKDKFKNDQGVVSSSPFKFANPRTQQEVNSYYAQNKINDDKKKQRRLS
eukprot:Seg3003.4 transcript_id=Seg3003.4/GoldUCD/mRNA.D3Y31 product="hypothetical protein" protein_id=Seg3003.4/GoldUCD/D3Y31